MCVYLQSNPSEIIMYKIRLVNGYRVNIDAFIRENKR